MDSQNPQPPNPSEINPAFFEMLKGLGEKTPRHKKHAFSLKSLDGFGSQPTFSWNYASTFKTKVGVFWTTLCAITLTFATCSYVHEYIFCGDPSVSTQSSWGLIPSTATFNNLNDIIAPAFSFSHITVKFSGKKKPEQSIELPSDEILRCHFDFYAEFYTSNIFDFESVPVKVPLKRDCENT
jgi:hypothetical protein